jgi:hypothetical protein
VQIGGNGCGGLGNRALWHLVFCQFYLYSLREGGPTWVCKNACLITAPV